MHAWRRLNGGDGAWHGDAVRGCGVWLRGVAGVNGPEAQLHMRRMRFVGVSE